LNKNEPHVLIKLVL